MMPTSNHEYDDEAAQSSSGNPVTKNSPKGVTTGIEAGTGLVRREQILERDSGRGLLGSVIDSIRRARLQDWILLPLLVAIVIAGALANSTFFTWSNIVNNVFQNSAVLGVVVVAECLILISGRFDLSLESTVALAPMVGVWMFLPVASGGLGISMSPYLAILVMLAVGALVGYINGFFAVQLNLNSFIVTFALLMMLRGLTLGITSGQSLSGLPKEIVYLGSARWLNVPASVWIFVILFIVAGAFLKMHPKGRAIFALGGNPEAARATGTNVQRLAWTLYVVAGVLAAVAGLLLTGRIASVTVDQGENLIFSVLAVAVLGGVSLDGGRGRMANVFIATILLAVITNLLTLLQVPTFWVDASYGAIILISLAIQGAARVRRRVVATRRCVVAAEARDDSIPG